MMWRWEIEMIRIEELGGDLKLGGMEECYV